MSILDTIYNAATGNLTEAQIKAVKDQAAADVARASAGADPGVIAERQRQVESEVGGFIRSIDADPNVDAGGSARGGILGSIRLPGLGSIGSPQFLARINTLVKGVLILGVVIGVGYVGLQIAPGVVGGIKKIKKARR